MKATSKQKRLEHGTDKTVPSIEKKQTQRSFDSPSLTLRFTQDFACWLSTYASQMAQIRLGRCSDLPLSGGRVNQSNRVRCARTLFNFV